MLLQIEAARLLTAGHDVLFVDFESDAAAIVERLLTFGATHADIRRGFDYRHPDVNPKATPAELDAWTDMLRGRYALAVIDGVTDSLGIFGYATKDNDDIAAWMRVVPKNIATQTGAAVVVIDHVAKDTENRGRFAIGGQAKLSGLTGAGYTVEIVEPLGRGLRGVITLRVGKDRPGYVRGNSGPMRKTDRTQESARIVVDSRDQMTVTIEPPYGSGVTAEGQPARRPFRLTGTMQKISERLEEAGHPVSGAQLEGLVGGNRDRVREAARTLRDEGYITISAAARGALMHESMRSYRQRQDPLSDLYEGLEDLISDPTSPTSPDLAPTSPGRGAATSPTTPPPLRGVGEVSGDPGEPTSPNFQTVRRVVAGKEVLIDLTTGEVLQ